MPTSEHTVEKIAALAAIELTPNDIKQFTNNLSTFLNMTQQLHAIDTAQVNPLFHPLDLHQALRDDCVTELNQVAKLAQIAPVFDNQLYQVPQVIEAGQ